MNPALRLAVPAALLAVLASASAPAQAPGGAAREVRFNRDIRPILSDRCFHCHGPDENHRKAGLRLDRATGDDGAFRTRRGRRAITPGSLEKSALWSRVSSDDPKRVMPPPESHKARLDADELARIRAWILDGARYEDHWAFIPPAQPTGSHSPRTRPADPIDQLVAKRLQSVGQNANPQADRRTLVRRVTFDLTGLPPTREEIHAFLRDTSPDAYPRLVDRLLAKPQYGEHMARYWLDLVRFADTNGIHHDHYRELTPYRDWVIRAFNDNLPFDQFTRDQIAGDLQPEPSTDQLVASGFNRLHMIIDRGTALPEESLHRNVVDRVTAFGTAFLGLTVQCAVCHDHKYDPIRQRDFYQLYAFFNSFDGAPETGGRRSLEFRRGLQRPYISLASDAQENRLAFLDARLAIVEAELATANKAAAAERAKRKAAAEKNQKRAAAAKGAARVAANQSANQPAELAPADPAAERQKQLEAERNQIRRQRDAVLMEIPAAMVMQERAQPRPAHILIRGAYDNPGAEVRRDTPAFLPPLRPAGATPNRLDLANWLLRPDHPLTARVVVNRFWQQLFGIGLVETAEDFGTQGTWPSHPELLDHLAVAFVASDWDVKALLRRIVLTETYRRSSLAPPDAYRRDPRNRLLARGARFRMDGEMIRDQILATSGLLNPQMFGKSVKPPQPAGIWKAVSLPSSYPRVFQADTGDAIYRRSVYTFWKRGMPPPQLALLNAPTRESCVARRERTNTPLQALLLLNENQYLHAAGTLARRSAVADASQTDAKRLAWIFETITSRLPDPTEETALLSLLADLRRDYAKKPELARVLDTGAVGAGTDPDDDAEAIDHAAWTIVTSTIYNLDCTRTRQ